MAGLAELLGIQMPGAAAADVGAVTPETGGNWDSFLKDPVSRSALLGFGMQLMTGGWGNGVQQAGAALGAGAASAGGTAKALNDFETEQQMRGDKLNEGAATRAQSEKNARIGADSRAEVANIRTQAMLERSRMVQGARTPDEGKIVAEALRKYELEERKNQFLTKKTDEEIAAGAYDHSQRVLQAYRATKGQSGGATRTDGPQGAGTVEPGGTVPGATPGKATSKNAPSWEQSLKRPDFAQLLQTPEGRAKILKMRPDFASQIEATLATEEYYTGSPRVK